MWPSASLPPTLTTRCVASAGTRASCRSTPVMTAPSTAHKVALQPLGSTGPSCVTTSGPPATYAALSKIESPRRTTCGTSASRRRSRRRGLGKIGRVDDDAHLRVVRVRAAGDARDADDRVEDVPSVAAVRHPVVDHQVGDDVPAGRRGAVLNV